MQATRKSYKIIRVAEATAGHTGDAGLAEESKSVGSGPELAPIVHGRLIVQIDLSKEPMLPVYQGELLNETFPPCVYRARMRCPNSGCSLKSRILAM